MKLSERIKQQFVENTLPSEVFLCAEQLESDSQMLKDLIEMLSEHDTYLGLFTGANKNDWKLADYWARLQSQGYIGEGSTPREAIAAAIKEWKK